MSKSKALLTTAVAAVVGLGTSGVSLPVQAAKMEKCYGVAKKGKNDCGTRLHACAGLAKSDGDAEEWIFLPKGSCDKIVGGSTTAKQAKPSGEGDA